MTGRRCAAIPACVGARRLTPNSLMPLVQPVDRGDAVARDDLPAAARTRVRQRAGSRLLEVGRNTFLGTAALVHESCPCVLSAGELRRPGRLAFFACASWVLRSVMFDSVREHPAERCGGALKRLRPDTQGLQGVPTGKWHRP